MNNLSQNELLSAYLDCELTAAEQAEVERLLATNPTARQLLDELRALSTVLQAMPQQKLGENLSQQVLQAAQRRMHGDGELDARDKGDSPNLVDTKIGTVAATPPPDAPEPLPRRTISERFFNRHALVWTGLAVAIAVMIAITENRPQNQPPARGLARGRAPSEGAEIEKSALRPSKLRELPAIRAIPDTSSAGGRSSTTTLPVREVVAGELKKETAPSSQVVPPLYAPSKRARESVVGGGAPLSGAVERWDGGLGNSAAGPAAPRAAVPGSAATPPFGTMGKDGPVYPKGGTGAYYGKAGQKAVGKSGRLASDVLVVYCDVSTEAVQRKSFDKLLDANGITWQRESRRVGKDGSSTVLERNARYKAKNAKQADREQQLTSDALLKQLVAAGNAELVYVQATPAQVRAALAGLEAQPNLFLSYSVKPAPENLVWWSGGTDYGGCVGRHLNFDGTAARGETQRIQEQVTSRGMPAKLAPKPSQPSATPQDTTPALKDAVTKPAHVAKGEAQGETQGQASKADAVRSRRSGSESDMQGKAPQSQRRLTDQNDWTAQEAGTDQFASQPPPSQQAVSQGGAPVQRVLFVLRLAGTAVNAAAARQDAKAQQRAEISAAEADKGNNVAAPAAPSPAEHAPSK